VFAALSVVKEKSMFGFLKKKDRDALVIKALKENGSNLSKLHNIDFNFDFSNFEQASAVAQAIDKDGFEVKMFENDDGTFTIEAKKILVPTLDVMQSITKQFDVLTEKHGGVYDGWGTEVVE
jgi:regulator of RNase E activity RraB